jgi:hypothetical protein
MLFHGVAFLSRNQHPEPTGSRRATPLPDFQHSSGHPPIALLVFFVLRGFRDVTLEHQT